MISLISNFSCITVVWVDDRVDLTESEIQMIVDNGGGTFSEFAPLDQTWADLVLSGNGAQLPEESLKNFASAASVLIEVCMEYRANLILTNFRDAGSHFSEPRKVFLLDLLNATKPLGTTAIDEHWDWDFYGAECVRHYALTKLRFRFLSRFRSGAGDPVRGILPDYFTEDSEVFAHSLRLDDPRSFRANFCTFIKNNLHHPDPALNEAILFSTSPPAADCQHDATHANSKPHWEHNALDEGGQNLAVHRWLEMDGNSTLDGESAKALLLAPNPWEVSQTKEGRPIDGDILTAVSSKLGFILNTNSDKFRLPTKPGLPFLMALRNLIWQMEQCKKTRPPLKITLTRTNGEHTLRLDLCPVDRNDNPIDITAFKTAFARAKAGQAAGENMTCPRLVNLERAHVWLPPPITVTAPTFLRGSNTDAATVSFDESKTTPGVLIHW